MTVLELYECYNTFYRQRYKLRRKTHRLAHGSSQTLCL